MKRFFRSAALGTAIFFCVGCGSGESVPEKGNFFGGQSAARWQYTDTAMGTVINQTLYSEEEETARAFSDEAMELLAALEQEKLSWRLETSEVYRINASAGSENGYPLSEDMAELLQSCMELSERTEGAFDITLGSLTRLWDMDEWAAGERSGEFQIPSGEAIEQALRVCGSHRLKLLRPDSAGESVPEAKQSGIGQSGTGQSEASQGEALSVYMPEGMRLDLGAVGKGLALSELQNLLDRQPDMKGAVISVGGSILTYGDKPDGSAWKVGIVNPFDTSSNVGILSLEGQWCVSTSGDYERCVESDGVRYHHILDPDTGFPADTGVRGVTILSKDGFLSDALSTACFILGPEKGMELAAQYGAEVLFVMSDGQIIMSEGMEICFRRTEK